MTTDHYAHLDSIPHMMVNFMHSNEPMSQPYADFKEEAPQFRRSQSALCNYFDKKAVMQGSIDRTSQGIVPTQEK